LSKSFAGDSSTPELLAEAVVIATLRLLISGKLSVIVSFCLRND
jgi:hypothetical protein